MNRAPTFLNFLSLIVIAAAVYAYGHRPWTMLRVIGLALMVSALIPLIVARAQLGKSFSLTPQARQLVTHGIYSCIRNPIYVFATLLLVGLFLFIGNPYFFLVFVVLIPLQFFRARAEAPVLEEHFGDQYRQYKAHLVLRRSRCHAIPTTSWACVHN